MPQAALEGIRVTELTWVAAGPYAGELLALLGAEVVKIESRRRPDAMRGRPAGYRGGKASWDNLDASLRFSAVNLNKQSVGLDLSRPEGRELAKRIMQHSDVLIENLRPGVVERLGLGYEDLSQVDPALVMVSISARGQRSPERGLPGYASIFGALGGLSHLTGYPDGPPAEMRIPMDFATGTMAALAVLGALLERQATGKGQHIDLAASDVPASFIGEVLLHYSLTGRVHSRQGNRHPTMAPHNCYPCRGGDRWVTIVVATEAEWQALCQALGNPTWARHPRFQDADSRWLHQEELDRHLAAWTRQHTHRDVMNILQRCGVAAVPSFSLLELYRDPHIQERGVFVEVDHPVLGKHTVEGAPWKLSRTPPLVHRAGPLLAEHNRPVLQGLLGLTEEEVNKLAAEGVLT
jgi:benzylsuccinate CoA-transferase BbsF subunit